MDELEDSSADSQREKSIYNLHSSFTCIQLQHLESYQKTPSFIILHGNAASVNTRTFRTQALQFDPI